MVLQSAEAAMAGIWTTMIIIWVVFCIIGILLAVWTYKDAKKRNMNAVAWLLIVLICGCCGCIIYLIVRKSK